jgi:hypothetical protein
MNTKNGCGDHRLLPWPDSSGPFRLDVIAANTLDAVASAGGFLCDRALAGWHVRVFLPSLSDLRSLQILGAAAILLDHTSSDCEWPDPTSALTVSAELFETNATVRQFVTGALRGDREITLWGSPPKAISSQLEPVQHHISTAARAFKSHALTAVAKPCGNVVAAETFCGRNTLRPGEVATACLTPT